MFSTILTPIINLLLPGAKPWVRKFLALLIPALIEIVGDFLDKDEDDEDTLPEAIAAVHAGLDEVLDVLPEWRDLSEDRRDLILDGVAELALFLADVSKADKGTKKALIKGAKRFRNQRLPDALLED